MNNCEKAIGPCVRCGKTLRAIGTAREGGKKTHGDWVRRSLHKKCWKEEKHEQATLDYNTQVLDRLQNEPLGVGPGWVFEN